MLVTVISPGELVSSKKDIWKAHTIFSHHFKGSGEVRFHGNDSANNDIFLTDYYKKKAVTQPLIPYETSTLTPSKTSTDDQVHALTEEGTRMLWHQRLGHMNLRGISDIHKSVDGIPIIKHHCLLDSCPSCLSSKLRHVPAGDRCLRNDAEVIGQGLSLGWAFLFQKSKYQERMQ